MKKTANFGLFLLGSLLILSCGEEEKKEVKFVRPVKSHVVSFVGGEKVRTFSGTAQTEKIIILSFRNT
ncbi:MAG: hypothetical protein AAF361_12955 [Bacteroidota bacterium]